MEGSAPKHQRPAFCATLAALPGRAAPDLSCGHAANSVRRLCPCEPLPGVQQGGQVDSLGGGGAAAGTQQQALQLGQQGQQQVQPQAIL